MGKQILNCLMISMAVSLIGCGPSFSPRMSGADGAADQSSSGSDSQVSMSNMSVQSTGSSSAGTCYRVPNLYLSSQGISQCLFIDISLYKGLLNRAPDQEGLNFWVKNSLAGAVSCSQTAVFFINTPQFKARASSTDYIVARGLLYQALLGRSLANDSAAINYFTQRYVSLTDTAKMILASREFDGRCRSYGFNGAGSYSGL